MSRLFSRPTPDWTDRRAVTDYAADGATLLRNDPAQARAIAGRIWDRAPTQEIAVHEANQLGMVFSRLDCTPRWRERLGALRIPTLVVHGRVDPFFPVGNGEALAAEIPGAHLTIQDEMGTLLPEGATGDVAGQCSLFEIE